MPLKAQRDARWGLTVAGVALILALGGNLLVWRVSTRNTDRLRAEAAARVRESNVRRQAIAASDLDLCVKVYSQVENAERQALSQTTVAFYTRLLPGVSHQAVVNLVRRGRENIRREIRAFDPAQCRSLPSQKLGKPSASG